jgi:hypothetical protein
MIMERIASSWREDSLYSPKKVRHNDGVFLICREHGEE